MRYSSFRKIFNNQWSMINDQYGFTLVELLAVMIVFVVVGGIVLAILITAFRTSHKTDTITLVRQNGNYALTQMAKTIRNARSLISPFPCAPVAPTPVDSVTVETPEGDIVTYSCTNPPSPTPATIASNSASIIDTTNVAVQSCSFTCTQQSKSDLPLITISFSLQQQTGSNFVEQKTLIPFQTSIVIRNINR